MPVDIGKAPAVSLRVIFPLLTYDVNFHLPEVPLRNKCRHAFIHNIEVTPWFHVTPDVQYIIDPGGGAYDDALAIGIRTQLSF